MLEMAILATQILKHFWGSMPPDPPSKHKTQLSAHNILVLESKFSKI